MALYYLVRHGEPDYDAVRWEGFFGFGCSFAPLSELGRRQAAAAAEDERLRGAELIVSSPYTRALETAAIISRRIDRELVVETELHEWEPDWTNNFRTAEEASALAAEFKRYGGEYPEGKTLCWETLSALRARIRRVADK